MNEIYKFSSLEKKHPIYNNETFLSRDINLYYDFIL